MTLTAPATLGACTDCGETATECAAHPDGACCALCEVRSTHREIPAPPVATWLDLLLWRRCRSRLLADGASAYRGRCELREHARAVPHALRGRTEWARWTEGTPTTYARRWAEVA